MPSHITHELFAQEVLSKSDTRAQNAVAKYPNFFVLGAQGPDYFLHNHRTKPSGLIFGKLLHTEGYGTYTKYLVEWTRDNNIGIDSPMGSYILGFATHPLLDRKTHPFINYYAGWVEPEQPASDRYYHCHAFLERIVDVFVLKMRGKKAIRNYDFFTNVDCGTELPHDLLAASVSAIESTFPEYDNRPKNEIRILNAYGDTRGFYSFTNPPNRDNLIHAYHRDRSHGRHSRRMIALFHPDRLPEMDYLNPE